MSFWRELKRRNVVKVGIAYAIVAWLLIQVASVLLPTFEAPDWVMRVFTFALVAVFPVVLLIAWAFELTPEGLQKTSDVPLEKSITQSTGQKLNYIVTGLLIVAVAVMAVDNYVLDGTLPEAGQSEAAPPPSEPVTTEQAADAAPVAVADPDVLPNSVAVIPFLNLSPNESDAYFAAGVHDEILNQLFKLSNLNVIARTSVMRYADTDKSIPEIARELNVGAVMEGSVRYADGQVVVTTQLIDAATNVHLWSESYRREFANIFEIQSDIAMNVANALRAEYSASEQQSIEAQPTASIDAYDHYLIAQSLARQGAAGLVRAVDEYRMALESDPEFALARLGLAQSLSAAANFSNDPERSAAAVDAVDRAIEVAGDIPAVLGLVANQRVRELDWTGAEDAFRDWMARVPDNNYEANLAYGTFLKNVGRAREAIPYLEQARRNDPLLAGPLIHLTIAYDGLGERDRAIELFSRLEDLVGFDFTAYAPQFWRVLDRDGANAAFASLDAVLNIGPGSESVREFLIAQPDAPDAVRVFKLAARFGDDAEAGLVALHDAYEDPTSDNFVVMLNVALLAAYYDDVDLSIAALRRFARQFPSVNMQFALTELMNDVRSHPGFKEMVRDLELDDYWRQAGWPSRCRPAGAEDFVCS